MPETDSLFREEALEHRATRRDPGAVLDLSPGWTRVAVTAILVTVLLALAAGFLASVDEYAVGPARIDPDLRQVVMLLPVSRVEHLQPGIVFTMTSTHRKDEIVLGQLGPVVDPAGAKTVLGKGRPKSARVTAPVIVATGRLPSDFPKGTKILYGNVKGRIGRERILFALVPGLKNLFEPGSKNEQ